MIPVEQRKLYVPGEQTGDCWKCCIASILELPYEDVPHFVEEAERDFSSYWNATQEWLRARGFVLATFWLRGLDKPLLNIHDREDIDYHFSAPGHWIGAVVSPRKTPEGENISHVVVMNGSEIAFDPHPARDDGHLGFTEAFLLVKT